ncbi:MAG TPA: amidohydrolase family protein [Kiloniellales bacterium]|jgi:L-fuconolactonase
MTRIDAHQHFWRLDRGDYGWLTPDLPTIYRDFTPPDLAPLLRQASVDRTIVVQAAPTAAETEFLLTLAAETDFIAGVVGWVDMEAGNAPDVISRLAAGPWLKGLRPMIQDIADVDWMLRSRLTPAFDAIVAAGLVFDALVKPPHLANLVKLIERHPEQSVVIDHCAKPSIARWQPGGQSARTWQDHMRALAQSPRAWCKLSGLVTEADKGWRVDDLRPYVDFILETFGPQRVIWGSDWPVLLLATDYDRWCAATRDLLRDLTAEARDAVFGGNAAYCYGL